MAETPMVSLGDVINVGSAVAGGVSAGKANKRAEKMFDKQLQFNRLSAQEARGFAYQMWNKQNEYDTPANQRQRLLDAGINPLSGSDWSNSSSDVSYPGSPSASNFSGYLNPVASAFDTAQIASQITNTNADTEQKYAETARTLALTPHEVRQIEENINLAKQNIQNLMSSKDLTDEQRKNLEIIDKWLDTEKEFELHKKISEIAVNKSIANLNDEQAEKLRYEIENILPLQKINAELSNEQLEELIKETRQKIALLSKQTGLAEKDLINYSYNHMPEYAKLGVEITKAAKENNKKQSEKIVNGLNKVGAWFMDRLSSAYDLSW